MKLRNSLLSRFLLIIMIAVLFIPIVIPLTSLLVYLPVTIQNWGNPTPKSYNGLDLEKMWHKEAKKLQNATPEAIDQSLQAIKKKYPESTVFWVNASGELQTDLNSNQKIPKVWSPGFIVDFMKKSVEGDPYTTVAFIGKNKEQGFMVFQIARKKMKDNFAETRQKYDLFFSIGLLLLFFLFMFLSWLFFYKLRKRLLYLQERMVQHGKDGIPEPVQVGSKDEIGELETSFNHMIEQLKEGKAREQEEEQLRRQLIANLSHDLRTPLTTLRAHVYSLKKEELSVKAEESLELIDQKISHLGQLVDNLLSYTLLTTGKYPFNPKQIDIVRMVRTVIAAWYPVFEKEAFEIHVDLPDRNVTWAVDPQWFERILDNLFQNIVRHTKEGSYIGIIGQDTANGFFLTIEDHGPGMKQESANKGAGIGLSIVSLMLGEMNLKWEIETNENGTKMHISEQR